MTANERRILVIENDKRSSEAIKLILESSGFQVISAFTGEQGLNLVRVEKPDLILSETMLPRMDGFTLTKLLKCDKRFQDTPVVILTARDLPVDLRRAKIAGADAYVTKPFDPSELIRLLERLLQENRPNDFIVKSPASRRAEKKAPPIRPARTSGKKLILVIENKDEIAPSLKADLESADFEVIMASSGDQGFRLARLEEPALILLEEMLPGVDGYTITRLLKSDRWFQYIPIVMLTAGRPPDGINFGKGTPVDAYVTKPFDPAKLLSVIKELIKKSPAKRPKIDTTPTWLDGLKRLSP